MAKDNECKTPGDCRDYVSEDGEIENPFESDPFPKWGHVVSIADSGVVQGWRWKQRFWRKQTQYYKTVKKSRPMHKLHPLKEVCKFGKERAVMEKAFTGIILKHPDNANLYVLTAGHVFPGKGSPGKFKFALYDFLKRYDPPLQDDYRWWMPMKYNLKGIKLMIASYGGVRAPDFAICKLRKWHRDDIRGYVITEEDMVEIPGSRDDAGKFQEIRFKPEYYFYPNGLGLKTASHEVTTMNRGLMWENSPYVFCPLLVTEGCSGTPVFHKVEVEEEGEKKVVDRFLGIVVSKGNPIADFDQEGKWQFKCKKGYNGTKILSLEGIRSYLYSLNSHLEWKSWQKQKDLKELLGLFPDGSAKFNWWDEKSTIKTDPTHTGTLEGNDSFRILNKTLYYNRAGEHWHIDLSSQGPLSIKFDGLNFRVYTNTKLIDDPTDRDPTPTPNFEDIAPGAELKPFDWPIAKIQPLYDMHLRFLQFPQPKKKEEGKKPEMEGMKVCPVFPYENRVVVLEGIGEMDIIDELPQRYCQRLQRAWVCDGHYIELSVHDNKYIRVRHVDGMVDVYSQAFKPEFVPDTNSDQKSNP